MPDNVYAYLYGLEKFGILLGLDNMRILMALLDHPERQLRAVHIAGTNGKGSTAAFLDAILRAAGYRTGRYTSPHLTRFSERITIDGRPIRESDIRRLALAIRDAVAASPHRDRPYTFFEVTTALAFRYFVDGDVDLAVVETGLGGRLDATNVAEPELSIITSIGFDHEEYLGDTIGAIAAEKAGIIKKGVPCVTAVGDTAASGVIARKARARSAPLFRLGREFRIEPRSATEFGYRGIDTAIDGLRLAGLRGGNQFENASCAIAAVELLRRKGWDIPDSAIRSGVRTAVWPGRFELVRRTPPAIVDGAHNPHGIQSLVTNLRTFFPGVPAIFVLSVLRDKDLGGIMKALRPLAATFFIAPNGNDRSFRHDELRARFSRSRTVTASPSITDALAAATAVQARQGGVVVYAGSLYGVGEARGFFRKSAR